MPKIFLVAPTKHSVWDCPWARTSSFPHPTKLCGAWPAARAGRLRTACQRLPIDRKLLKVLSVQPLNPLHEALGPGFEPATGHRLAFHFDVSAALKRQIDAGDPFDVVLILPAMVDDLLKRGKVAVGTRRDIARAAIGVAVRKGAPKPDIGSAEAFKRALLDARSIAYSPRSTS